MPVWSLTVSTNFIWIPNKLKKQRIFDGELGTLGGNILPGTLLKSLNPQDRRNFKSWWKARTKACNVPLQPIFQKNTKTAWGMRQPLGKQTTEWTALETGYFEPCGQYANLNSHILGQPRLNLHLLLWYGLRGDCWHALEGIQLQERSYRWAKSRLKRETALSKDNTVYASNCNKFQRTTNCGSSRNSWLSLRKLF